MEKSKELYDLKYNNYHSHKMYSNIKSIDVITKPRQYMERMKELIQNVKKVKDDENRKVMADINDYITNYSDLTFDEYKQLKNSK